MLTIVCLFAPDGSPVLLAVDLCLPEDAPGRWRWGVGGVYVPALVGLA